MTPPRAFRTRAAFRIWLGRNHATAPELVIRCFKTHVADRGMTHREALDEALCYGWIDGVVRRLDAETYAVRFSPRRGGSIWSRVNVRRAEALLAEGRMAPAGIKAFEARQAKRTGVYSFENRAVVLAPEFLARFRANRPAWRFYQSRPPWYRRTTAHFVMSAKREETRLRRLEKLIECSSRKQNIPELIR